MYMEKIYFLFLLSAVFKKQQPFVALVKLLNCQQIHQFNHSLAHSQIIVVYLEQIILKDTFHPAHFVSYRPEWTC